MDQVREMFETNTLGTIAMTQAVLPEFRARRSGVGVNVTSSVTLRPLHLQSVYTASKAAVNAFTKSLALELEPFGVRARVVLPGRAPDTAFGDNARARMGMNIPEAYGDIAAQVLARFQEPTEEITQPLDGAEAVWRAATDPSCPMPPRDGRQLPDPRKLSADQEWRRRPRPFHQSPSLVRAHGTATGC